MSQQEIQLRPRGLEERTDLASPMAPPYDGPTLETHESIFEKVHRLLRNRYKWCALLSCVLAAAGVYGGYRLGAQRYMSVGIVTIKPVLPTILRQIPETGMMPFYDQFVQTQVQFILSHRVISQAMQSDAWKELGRPLTEDAVTEFTENLTVRPLARSEIIQVSYQDFDPRVATVAVNAVLDAYSAIHLEDSDERMKVDQLRDRQVLLSRQLTDIHDRIQLETDNFGIDGFRSLHQMKLQRLSALTMAANDVEAMIVTGEVRSGAGQGQHTQGTGGGGNVGSQDAAMQESEMTVADIGRRDPGMKALLRELQGLKFELDFRHKFLGENHPKKVEARALIAAKEADIEAYAKEYRTVASSMLIDGVPSLLGGETRKQLELRQARVTKLLDDTKSEIEKSGVKLLRAEKLQRQADQLVQDIEQARRRLDDLTVEVNSTGGRIRVSGSDGRAMLHSDTRVKYAAVGGVAGFGAAFTLFLVAGAIDRRFRSVHDARTSVGQLTLLGVLPSLPDDVGDPEQAAVAAHCVHQIRTLLQISPGAAGSRVFSVTSPASGTGKTSLTLAMGVSFAAANSRTLIIDCDIIGGGLTARVDAVIRRRVGQILRQQGLLTQQQLENALRVGATSRKRFGEILLDLGYVTRDDVDDALDLQHTTSVGLLDALGGDRIDDCIADTGIERLSILPLGSASPMDVSKLSPSAIRRLIDHVRHQYDIVLIDTGPVPGSLEASVAAAACDGVVLVLSRGDHRPVAERCIQHLRDVGAVIAGVVFNRAEARDMEVSTTANRTSSFVRPPGVSSAGLTPEERVQSPRYGPIASAVTGRSGSAMATDIVTAGAAAKIADRDQ